MDNNIAKEICIPLADALKIADLLKDMTVQEQPSYRADEAQLALDGLAQHIGRVVDINEQGEI